MSASAKELMLREMRDQISRNPSEMTEWQLREDDPNLDAMMEKVNDLKIQMYEAKIAASKAVEEEYHKQIDKILRSYMLQVRLSV